MKVIVIFEIKRKKYRLKEKKVKKVLRELFGYKNKSNFGNYKYNYGGLLQELGGKKIAKNAFIIDEKYLSRILRPLRKLHASIKKFYIIRRKKK